MTAHIHGRGLLLISVFISLYFGIYKLI
jgi:hypothetical protein